VVRPEDVHVLCGKVRRPSTQALAVATCDVNARRARRVTTNHAELSRPAIENRASRAPRLLSQSNLAYIVSVIYCFIHNGSRLVLSIAFISLPLLSFCKYCNLSEPRPRYGHRLSARILFTISHYFVVDIK